MMLTWKTVYGFLVGIWLGSIIALFKHRLNAWQWLIINTITIILINFVTLIIKISR